MFNRFKESRIYKYLFIVLLFIVSLTSVAFSSWSLGDTKFNSESYRVDDYVCVNKNTGTEYYRIEDALDKASSGHTIVVFSNPYNATTKTRKEIKITRDCVIKSGVNLILPYSFSKDNTTYNYQWDGLAKGMAGDFSDCSTASINKYLACEVTVANNVTITNKGGSIYIGGELGHQGVELSGQTSGYYAQITLGNNAKLVFDSNYNNNSLTCYGYIKESSIDNGSRLDINNGTLKMPFVVYDFAGGTNTVGVYLSGVSPFSVYDLPNIWPTINFSSQATLIGMGDLFANNARNTTSINILGTSKSLINLNNGARAVIKYHHTDPFINTSRLANDGNYTQIDFYNGGSLGTLSMKVQGQNVETSKVLFPFSLKHHINLYNGTYNVTNKVKMLPDSHLYLNEDATLNINKEFIVYNTIDVTTTGKPISFKYPVKTEAILQLDGNVNINQAFGGYLRTTNNKNMYSLLTINTNKLSMTSEERFNTNKLGAFFGSSTLEYKTTQQARADILTNGTINKETNLEQSVYLTNANQNYFNKADNLNKYTINYHLNGGTVDGETVDVITKDYYFMKNTSVTLNSFSISEPTKKYYQFDKWVDSNNNSLLGTVINTNGVVIDAYATYVKREFNIYYGILFEDDTKEVDYTNPNTIFSFNIDTFNNGPIQLAKPTDVSNDYFYGWFLNGDESTQITEITLEMGYEDINLVGIFSKNIKYEITFEDSDTYNSSIPTDNRLPNSILTKFRRYASTLDKVTLPYSATNIYDSDDSKMYYATFKFSDGTEFDPNREINSNTVIYIVWEKKLVINYLNESNTSVASQYIAPNKDATLFDATKFDESYTAPVDTSNADHHIHKTLNGFSTEINGSKVYELGQTISNLSNNMNLYPYYDSYYTYLLECIKYLSLANSEGFKVEFNNISFVINGYGEIDNKEHYLTPDTLVTVTFYKDWRNLKWRILNVESFVDGYNLSSGNTKSEHIVKFYMPNKKVVIEHVV